MSRDIQELEDAARLLGFDYEILQGTSAEKLIGSVLQTFEPGFTQGHLLIGSKNSVRLKTDDHEFSFSEKLDDEPVLIFFQQYLPNTGIIFKLNKGRLFSKLLTECYAMEYFMTNEKAGYLISVNWYVIEILNHRNFPKP